MTPEDVAVMEIGKLGAFVDFMRDDLKAQKAQAERMKRRARRRGRRR